MRPHRTLSFNSLMAWVIASVIIYTSWARGGSPHGYQPPMVWLSILCWIILLGRTIQQRTTTGIWKLLRDPLFYCFLLFMTLLALQWHNSSRVHYFDQFARQWQYTEALRRGWPSSIRQDEALEMLEWFFPAFSIALALRHGLQSRRGIRLFLNILVANAALLGTFGIVQFLSKTREIYWHTYVRSHFFASFGYQNHAAEFFYLMLALALGLACWSLRLGRDARRLQKVFYLVTTLITLVSVHLSLCTTSSLLSWFTVSIAIVCVVAFAVRNTSPAVRLNILVTVALLTMLTFYIVSGTAREKVRWEISQVANADKVVENFNTRWWQVTTAAAMWKDHKWFGVGGWGYRHLVPIYLPHSAWSLLTRGRANVHNDTMQFLAEFGVVGIGLILISVLTCCWPLIRHPNWRHPLILFPALGIALTYLHSMIDLPFRSPAILFSWLAILTAVSQYAKLRAAQPNNQEQNAHA